ncbi:spindle and kinetochore-associated protein 1-like protein [Pyrus ussuriensis x Pyrus communis]|uniref:Spindle and kinetochore-associated protein 1-like protein n=1 Tax=Pyrus ussuriensis x Pyrus communis TaxID=2448454 RepID=A0A5N5EWV3_9ROSA|nr:spindle and kinetochore-associated protein 1-like protein [Pyrus ussuriensis x Pyrus communis]
MAVVLLLSARCSGNGWLRPGVSSAWAEELEFFNVISQHSAAPGSMSNILLWLWQGLFVPTSFFGRLSQRKKMVVLVGPSSVSLYGVAGDLWDRALVSELNQEMRDIAMTGVNGKHFFLETDMKGPTLKPDDTGKAILTGEFDPKSSFSILK